MAATNQTKPQKAIFSDKFKVNYDDINLSSVFCPKPSTRQIPGKETNQTYLGASAEYKIKEENEKPEYEEFRFQGPILYSKFGISQLVDETTKNISYSIYSPLPQNDDDIKFFTHETLEGLHETMCDFVAKYAEDIGKPGFKNIDVAKGSIPKLYKYKKDKVTNKFYYERDPFMYNKLSVGADRTVFVDLEGNIIPWSRLENVEMKFIPIYTLGFYSGGMGISFPMKTVEATVLFYRKANVTSSQADTIDKYKDQYMEEYKRSLESMSRLSTGDGLKENESTLGGLQQSSDSSQTESSSSDSSFGESSGEKQSPSQNQSNGATTRNVMARSSRSSVPSLR